MTLRRFYLLFLPFLLLLVTGLVLGFYCETNDDLTIVALLRGRTAAAPVADFHLYFHGYAAIWSRLYTAYPAVPWYALTLYGLLYVATVLLFAILNRLLQPKAGYWLGLGCMLLFYGVAWLEHSFWFNYTRVPILLAGTGLLFAAQRASVRWALVLGLLAFVLAWLIRPSVAVLGVLAAAPGAWWLAGWRAAPALGGMVLWILGGALWLNVHWSPAASTFRRLDVLKSNLNDFQLAGLPRQPLAAKDSLALAATKQWMFADSTLVNEGTLKRVIPLPSTTYFLTHIAPPKLSQLLRQLPRDYFPIVLLIGATALLVLRNREPAHLFWLVQIANAGVLIGLGVVLKLPPRVALPLLDFWALSNIIFLLGLKTGPSTGRWVVPVVVAVLALASIPYGYKTWHRWSALRQERHQNTARLRGMLSWPGQPPQLLISDAVESNYKAQSPFADDPLAGMKLLSLAGWHTLHPSQPAWRYHLAGTRDFTTALIKLGARPEVAWVLSPEGKAILNRQLLLQHQPAQPVIQLVPQGRVSSENATHAYQMRAKFLH